MKRKEIEKIMKANKVEYLPLIFNEEDSLGYLCHLSGGILMNCYTEGRVPARQDIWGFVYYVNNTPQRAPLTEENLNEILFCK